MAKISSFSVAAGLFAFAALVKVSVFAIALMLLGAGARAQPTDLARPCPATGQTQWLSIEAMQSKVEALGYTVQKVTKNACGELRLSLAIKPR